MKIAARTLSCLVGAAVLGLALVPAEAGFYSGKDLYDSCTVEKGNSAYFEKSYECVAYIAGAVDAFNTTREANGLKSCIPGGVTVARLRDVTVDYLDENVDERSKSASSLVFTATRKAWPCVKKSVKRKKK